MKTRNSSKSQWVRHMSRLLIAVIAFMSVAGNASARILFQDDDFDDVASEGIIINFDDGGDEDVTLQLGNDGSDATMIFDDGTGDVTFATDGGDFSFSDDNLTTTGGAMFSGTSEFHIREVANEAVADCTTAGEIVLDTGENRIYVCSATGTPGTWVASDAGSSQDFEDVFSVDADDTLTTTNQDFTIDTGTADFLVDSNDWSVDAAGNITGAVITGTSLTDGTATLTGGSLNGLTGADATTEDTIEGLIFDADAEAVTGVWTWADNVAQEFGTDSDVLIQYDETGDDRLEITGTNADVYFEDSIIVDTNATVNGTLDANGIVTLGDNGESVTINSDTWDVTALGVGSGFTGFTSTGTVNFSGAGAFRIREDANPAANAACATVNELILDTTDNEIQICTATGIAGAATWTAVSSDDADTLDGLDSLQFLRSDTSDNYTSGTLTFDSGTTLAAASGSTVDINTGALLDVNGEFDASSATEFHIREVPGDPNLIGTGAACTTLDEIVLDTASDRIYVCTGTGAAGTGTWRATGPANVNVDTMTWEAEYPDVVVYGDSASGLSHKGKLEALYDVTNSEQYYHWSTKKNEDEEIDLRFRYELPADFVDAGDLTLDYRTLTAAAGDNSVQVIVNNDTDSTTCHTDAAAPSAANTWGTLTITAAEIETGCVPGAAGGLDAGDVIEVIIRLIADDTNAGWADVGTMSFAYTN